MWMQIVWCDVVGCGAVRCGAVRYVEGTVTKRQWEGCLAHGKMQNGWALILNPEI